MGAWGIKTFENDEALDFVGSFIESGTPLLKDTLKKVATFPQKDYLDISLGVPAIACAEILCAKGKGASQNLPEDVQKWLADHRKWCPSSKLRDTALRALDRILGENSEIKDV